MATCAIQADDSRCALIGSDFTRSCSDLSDSKHFAFAMHYSRSRLALRLFAVLRLQADWFGIHAGRPPLPLRNLESELPFLVPFLELRRE